MTFGSGHPQAGPDVYFAGIRPCSFNEFGCLTSFQPRFSLLFRVSESRKLLILWSGRRGSNPRRPAWEQVGWMCLQQLSVSGALYRLTASLAKSAFSSLTPSNRGFFEVQCTVIRTSICAASHGINPQRLDEVAGPVNHGSPDCLTLFHHPRSGAAHRLSSPSPTLLKSNTVIY